MSADIMASLCGICVHVGIRMNNFFSKSTSPKDMLIPYLSRMKNCSRHADLFVYLFPRGITSEVPHPKFENFKTLSHFYPTALKGCWGIVFTHGVRMGGRAAGKEFVRAVSQKP